MNSQSLRLNRTAITRNAVTRAWPGRACNQSSFLAAAGLPVSDDRLLAGSILSVCDGQMREFNLPGIS
jgi:hypothetical protein